LCWLEDRKLRPRFANICSTLESNSELHTFSNAPPSVFAQLQTSWKSQVNGKFEEIKEQEKDLKSKEEETMRLERERLEREHKLISEEERLKRREEELKIREQLLEERGRTIDHHSKTKSMEIRISEPFDFKHVLHVGKNHLESFGFQYDVSDFDIDWMLVVNLAGVTSYLGNQNWLKFILEFTRANSDVREIIGDLLNQQISQSRGFLEFGLSYNEIQAELNRRVADKLAKEIEKNQDLTRNKSDNEDKNELVQAFPQVVDLGETIGFRWNLLNARSTDLIGLFPNKRNNKDYIYTRSIHAQTSGFCHYNFLWIFF